MSGAETAHEGNDGISHGKGDGGNEDGIDQITVFAREIRQRSAVEGGFAEGRNIGGIQHAHGGGAAFNIGHAQEHLIEADEGRNHDERGNTTSCGVVVITLHEVLFLLHELRHLLGGGGVIHLLFDAVILWADECADAGGAYGNPVQGNNDAAHGDNQQDDGNQPGRRFTDEAADEPVPEFHDSRNRVHEDFVHAQPFMGSMV